MVITETKIADAWIAESVVIGDHRGAFSRLFCADELKEVLGSQRIVQINHSLSRNAGTVRGMHYQIPPHAEMKIVRCLRGRVFDVAVDLRQGSKTFLDWVAVELSPENRRAFVIPAGCAHGFQTLEEDTELLYLHTAFYAPEAESGVRFDDPKLNIRWPLAPVEMSVRDQHHPLLAEDFKGVSL
jgi:dTDP-4-dehydrorhamnose 3,5-epimerase